MNRIFKNGLIAILGISAFSLGGCKKSFFDTKPTDQVATSEVFKTIEGAEAALQGIHRTVYEIADHDAFGYPSIALMWDLMGEDMSLSGGGSGWFVGAYRLTDARGPENTGSYIWGFFYRIVNNANYILANIDNIEADQARKDYVEAGARFYRAWAYYNLANCYMFTYAGASATVAVPVPGVDGYTPVASFKEAACVPIYTDPTTADHHQANPRASVQEVYNQIISDLDEALALYAVSDRARMDKSEINMDVAKGLYARVALTMQNWPKAEQMAREARANYAFATGVNINDGFNNAKNSEWIWGSIINTEQSGIWASFLSQMDWDMQLYAAGQEKRINTEIYNNDMDTTDIRRTWWISREQKRAGSPYSAYGQRKFRAVTLSSTAGDFPMMRASEMALIEAEAMVMQGNNAGATTVLNDFARTRQASFDASGLDARQLDSAVLKQRRIELWGEGFRYFDLQRSFAAFPIAGVQNTVGMQRLGSQGHSPGLALTMLVNQYGTGYLFRIPGSEREQNPQVVQNP